MTGAPLSRKVLHSCIQIVITNQSNFTEMSRYHTDLDMTTDVTETICAFLFHTRTNSLTFWTACSTDEITTSSASSPVEKCFASFVNCNWGAIFFGMQATCAMTSCKRSTLTHIHTYIHNKRINYRILILHFIYLCA